MDVIFAIVGVAVGFLILRGSSPATVPALTPAPPVPNAHLIDGGGGGLVSGGYQITSPFTTINGFARFASSAAVLPSTVSYPPPPAPPPFQRGGIAGTAGTGGIPLGSGLRTGLTLGPGSTVVPTTALQRLPRTGIL